MAIQWNREASVAATERAHTARLVAAFVTDGLLATLGWQCSASLRERETRPDGSHLTNPAGLAPDTAPPAGVAPAGCPPAPPCLSVDCEPSVVAVTRRPESELDAVTSEVAEGVQATLAEIMREVGVRASFDLDCSSHPCLAVFADQIPSEEDRSLVVQRLVESMPDSKLRSTTIIGEDLRISWVLVVADEELSEADELRVRARVDELLP